MKKIKLKNIIRESIKELMNEQTSIPLNWTGGGYQSVICGNLTTSPDHTFLQSNCPNSMHVWAKKCDDPNDPFYFYSHEMEIDGQAPQVGDVICDHDPSLMGQSSFFSVQPETPPNCSGNLVKITYVGPSQYNSPVYAKRKFNGCPPISADMPDLQVADPIPPVPLKKADPKSIDRMKDLAFKGKK